ncbi:MAG: tetratricopeptide repeat protein [Desulfobacteraceae bacterium]|nr:tetratricopeptide repeat protein [Desulfobacteraceae bacterium]
MKILDRLYARLGFNALVSEQYGKAEKYFLKIRKRTGESMGTNHNLGMVYLASGDFKRAETCYLRELEKFGGSYSRIKVLADVYYALQDAEKSLCHYRLAEGLASGEPDLPSVRERIRICENKDRFRDAAASYALCKKGIRAEQNNDLAGALDYYTKAIGKDPTNVQALNNAGVCCERQKDLEKAGKYFKQAYELSGLPAIGQNLKKIERAISSRKDEAQ